MRTDLRWAEEASLIGADATPPETSSHKIDTPNQGAGLFSVRPLVKVVLDGLSFVIAN